MGLTTQFRTTTIMLNWGGKFRNFASLEPYYFDVDNNSTVSSPPQLCTHKPSSPTK